jgi:hypothetical protein
MKLRRCHLPALALGLVCCAGESFPDHLRPDVDGSLSPIEGRLTYIPGDTVTLTLTGSDDEGLRWMGYALGDQRTVRDSFSAAGREATIQRTFVVPRSWIGTSAIYAFAHDASGNQREAYFDSVHVIDGRRRPISTLVLPAPVRDFTIDSARNLLYLSLPAAQQVAVVDLATRQLRPPVQLFGSPWGLDLTPGGDSLVVALRRTHSLAFVDLATGAVDTVQLAIPSDGFNEGPGTLRVMQNRKVILAITWDGFGYAQNGIREFDLNTGTERTRHDAFTQGTINGGFSTATTALVRNSERTRLVGVLEGCCPAMGAVYSAVSDTFAAQRPTVDRFYPMLSSDATADRILVDDVVFDGSLNLLVRLGPQTVDSLRNWATVISPDGEHAYIAREQFYKKVRTDDAVEVERVVMTVNPYLMFVTPRSDLLVAVTGNEQGGDVRLRLIDLQ